MTHQTVERCLRRAQTLGVKAALKDSPRPGREPTITNEAKMFVLDLACRKAKDLGYPHEVWTTRLLAEHVRERAPAVGYACLANLAQGTLCKILAEQEIKPHKVRDYLERRDPEFDEKMAEVLSVYREVEQLKQAAEREDGEPPAVAIISYDEKPGIQALATTSPDLPPVPMRHPTFARDHEYVRMGTLSLLAGIDLVTGVVHASVEKRHRSREFVADLAAPRRRLPAADRDQDHSRQSLRPQIQGNQGLARPATRRTLHLRIHAQARLLAQPHRGLLLQARPIRASPHPRRLAAGTAPENPGRHRSHQPPTGRSHLEMENCRGRMI